MQYRINPKQITNIFNDTQKQVADRVAKNQLCTLGIELDNDTAELYRKCFGRRQVIVTAEEMRCLICTLAKIEDANRSMGIYVPDVLHSVIQEELYHLAYFNLMHRKRSGLVFLRSKFYRGLKLNTVARLKLWLRRIRTALTQDN